VRALQIQDGARESGECPAARFRPPSKLNVPVSTSTDPLLFMARLIPRLVVPVPAVLRNKPALATVPPAPLFCRTPSNAQSNVPLGELERMPITIKVIVPPLQTPAAVLDQRPGW